MRLASRRRAIGTLGVLAVLFAASANLAGCVTDQTTAANAVPAAIPPGQAMLTISRVNNYYGALVPVGVTANGANFTSLGLGESFTGGIKPGPVTLTTSMWSTPGSYTVHFNAEAGKRYAFELQPRTAGLAWASAGIIGSVVDAAANAEQSGPYKLVELPVPGGR
jgi:hypothetical protein